MKQDAAFKALADPTRRQLIRLLNRGSRSAGELAQTVGMSPAALSHHLSQLKVADLVRTERRGQSIVYSANATVFENLTRVMLDLFTVHEEKRK
ncbi:MAG TPA: metalloregulator ArsR/SmtB family transcription factor [Gammaproteobacteria bacterium]|nr:metalloregulator ArsR/SmtB family transcription factor [Gammaproteobacteria bacterium]